MASALPPRLQKSNSIKREGEKSSLQILMQMGFPKQRSEKALAATGDQGVQLASDWLLSHVSDPYLDTVAPREYILYLCPTGELQKQLMTFWEKSLSQCGWNSAHSYFPHMTLCRFFTVEDHKAGIVKQALKKLQYMLDRPPGKLKLDFFSQSNFIGLFVQEAYYKYLTEVTSHFVTEVKKSDIFVEHAKKQLHISLGYQHQLDQHDKLDKLAREIDLNADCKWEIRLYSRDARLGKYEVRKVVKAYKGSLDDELDLFMGDFIFMDPQEIEKSEDGWYNGCSWVSGMVGLFPGTYTQRTAQTWAWALHGAVSLNDNPEVCVNGACGTVDEVYDNLWDKSDLYAKVNKKRGSSKEEKSKEEKPKPVPRQLYVMRHGERLDFVFGRVWVEDCFDDKGNYIQKDLNMPKTVPKRAKTHMDFLKDAPLTTLGQMQAFLTGEALKSAGVKFDHVYVSPSLRCVQTIAGILKAMGQKDTILHIEPGIFEWLGWYQLGLPKWFTPPELKSHGFNIDVNYKQFVPITKFDLDESIEGYYRRSGETARHILKMHEKEGGNVLIMGHAGTLEVCTRQLFGKPFRSSSEFREICPQVPYCGLLKCQEDVSSKKWTPQLSPILPLTHGQNKKIDILKIMYPS